LRPFSCGQPKVTFNFGMPERGSGAVEYTSTNAL
jgi:hypothetical protein